VKNVNLKLTKSSARHSVIRMIAQKLDHFCLLNEASPSFGLLEQYLKARVDCKPRIECGAEERGSKFLGQHSDKRRGIIEI